MVKLVLKLFFTTVYLTNFYSQCLSDHTSIIAIEETKKCPLWHIPNRNGQCVCSTKLETIVTCTKNLLYIGIGDCMTWNNESNEAQVQHCLFTPRNFVNVTTCSTINLVNNIINIDNHNYNTFYHIPVNLSGEKLNSFTCKAFNRKGTQCRQCIDGYGPAPFTDGNPCYDCSKHKYLWIMNLFIQIFMTTVMYILFIPLQINATSSPFNIIFTYTQLVVNGLKLEGRIAFALVCILGEKFTDAVMILLGIFNLDYFYAILPPSCLKTSIKVIDILLFDFIVAIYPLFLTFFIFLCIKLYNSRNRVVVLLAIPMNRCLKCVNAHWDPTTTILKTFTTFFMLSFSKMFFISIKLTLPVQAYNSKGEAISNSTVLLFDPMIKPFHSEHIPYAVLAIVILVAFNLLPTMILLLYPTRCFRKSMNFCKCRRWYILHHIMDMFQGPFKDGTEGTRDYRYFSALYFLLRIGLGLVYVLAFWINYKNEVNLWKWLSCGMFHVFLGMLMLSIKPYKKTWMNRVDGLLLIYVGISLIMVPSSANIFYFPTVAVIVILISVGTLVYTLFMCIKRNTRAE